MLRCPILEIERRHGVLCRGILARIGLSKIDGYLVDNVSSCRLSWLDRAVNDKAGCGTQFSEKQPRRESFPQPQSKGPLTKNARRTGHPGLLWGESVGQPPMVARGMLFS